MFKVRVRVMVRARARARVPLRPAHLGLPAPHVRCDEG